MVATSGDESYVMFSMIPEQALLMTAVLFVVALVAGWLSDILFTRQEVFLEREDHELDLHHEEICHCFSRANIGPQLREITFPRALLVAMFGGLLFLLATGLLGPVGWDWKKITFATRSPGRICNSSPCRAGRWRLFRLPFCLNVLINLGDIRAVNVPVHRCHGCEWL